MNVTVFGSSKPQPGDAAYLEAYELGALLANLGHTVVNGGYCGTMEAVSKGVAEAGGKVVGVTCREIENWRPLGANQWVSEVDCQPTLLLRLEKLIQQADAAIALPGGPGTLTELALFWNLMIVHAMPKKPLILIGSAWKATFDAYREHNGINASATDWGLLHFVNSAEAAVKLLQSLTQDKE